MKVQLQLLKTEMLAIQAGYIVGIDRLHFKHATCRIDQFFYKIVGNRI
jgi:hypothetical protein